MCTRPMKAALSLRRSTVLVSGNGIDFLSVKSSEGPVVRIPGDEAHGDDAFARSYDLSGTEMFGVRYIRIDGNGSGSAGPMTEFDLDAVGAINIVGLDCNENGIPDDCDVADGTSQDQNGDGIPDECEGSSGEDCNDNGISDECDIDCGQPGGPCDVPGCGQSEDCQPNGIPDECDLSMPTTVVIEDDFDNGVLDPAWEVTLEDATGWEYAESGTELTVTDTAARLEPAKLFACIGRPRLKCARASQIGRLSRQDVPVGARTHGCRLCSPHPAHRSRCWIRLDGVFRTHSGSAIHLRGARIAGPAHLLTAARGFKSQWNCWPRCPVPKRSRWKRGRFRPVHPRVPRTHARPVDTLSLRV